MSLLFYDLIFCTIFVLAVALFIYKKRKAHQVQRQGLLFLYKTKYGVKLMDLIAKKYSKILYPLQYVILASGYILMILMLALLVFTVYTYIRFPVEQVISAPPIFPIFPYFTEFFGLNQFFPNFNFTIFLVSIAIIAISHEFAHGIFMRLNKIKIKSTGFAMLGPFVGAFVEQDDKQMTKAKKFPQLAILAAGTFANVIMAILFGIILYLFIMLNFVPAGVVIGGYASTQINLSEVSSTDTVTFGNVTYSELVYNNTTFFTNPKVLQEALDKNIDLIPVFQNTPAFNSQLRGVIIEIDGEAITTQQELTSFLAKLSPGDEIDVKTTYLNQEISNSLILEDNNGKAFMGIYTQPERRSGLLGFFNNFLGNQLSASTNYKSNIGDLGFFLYDLLWWIVMLNVLVALFNMVPASIFDGGRFFLITVWGLTGSKKAGERAFDISTKILLFALFLLMVKWVFRFF